MRIGSKLYHISISETAHETARQTLNSRLHLNFL